MLHLSAFYGTPAFGVSLTQLNAVQEQVMTTNAGQFLFNRPMSIVAAYAMGLKITRAQLNIPSYRNVALPELHPLELLAAPPSNPNIVDIRDTPLSVRTAETLGVLTSNNAAAGTDTEVVGVWLSGGSITPAPGGMYYPVRFTATIATVAGQWVLGQLTSTQQLPPGVYSVIGGQIVSATGVLGRLVFPGQLYRPGLIAMTSLGNRGPYQERPGMFGVLGQFNTITLPQLEMLCTGVDAAQTVTLDCIYNPAGSLTSQGN